ncbi:NAD(P)-dependent oxidoreductase [Hydrogenophaga sp.]|uniref:NAD(P)-dependent oxidoreductase n=1 Tax=Hydrogenophaga sp. TaxID=1904254 RepID=UPI0025BDD2E8|nr:NAD(P)-dependent oxidoreductase [Hydrogenophaga sp.]
MIAPLDTVAIVGAGNMGGGMVQRLRERGWPVAVCDIDAQRQREAEAAGAQLCATPLEAAQRLPDGGVMAIVVVDAAQCRDALWGEQGAAAALRAGQTVMLCPTIAPEDVASMALRLGGQGVDTLDAPMSGGPARARAGTMSLMLAGATAVIERHTRLLDDLSNAIFRVGERVGDGARTKLVNNLLAGINLAGAAEVIALAERLGLDANVTLGVIERSSGQSWIGTDRLRRALTGDHQPLAHMTLLAKDTGLAVAAAHRAGHAGVLGPLAAAVFAAALGEGMAGRDDAALLDWMRAHPDGLPKP